MPKPTGPHSGVRVSITAVHRRQQRQRAGATLSSMCKRPERRCQGDRPTRHLGIFVPSYTWLLIPLGEAPRLPNVSQGLQQAIDVWNTPQSGNQICFALVNASPQTSCSGTVT